MGTLLPKPVTAEIPAQVHRIEVTPRTMITLVLVLACSWLLIRLAPALLVLTTALMLVGLLSPMVERLEARGMRRHGGIALVFGVLFTLVLVLVTVTIPEVLSQGSALVEQEPALREKLAAWLAQKQLTAPLAASLRTINYGALFGNSTQLALSASVRAVELVAYSVGAVFLALYIMIDRDRLRGALFATVPRAQHIRLSRIMTSLEHIVGGYIRGQAITCVLMGVFTFILLTAVGVKTALALAVIATIADVLPYIGIILVIAPAVIATLPMGPFVSGGVAIGIFVYQEIESRLLMPLVYGRALRLPSSVVMFALLVGGTLMGIIGALLALPVAAAVVMLLDELRVELPGYVETPEKELQRERDDVNEQEYTLRTERMPVSEAAAIAVEITDQQTRVDAEPTEATASPPPP